MADTKVSALTALTTPAGEDLLYVVDDPSGTPTGKKTTVAELEATLAVANMSDAADFATVADLASTANGDGAALIGIEDAGGLITATTVEGALAENRAAIDAIEAAGYITATLTDEEVQDIVGAMLSGNTETLIAVTYQDADGTIDFVVDNDLANYSNSNSGFAVAATLASTATSAGASTIGIEDAGALITATTVEGALAELAGNDYTDESIQDLVGAMFSGNTEALVTVTYQDADGTIDVVVDGNLANYSNTATGFLSEIVTDTTPQLGGMLDVNGQSIGDGTLELIKFSETASAVNEITVTNATTTAAPSIVASGDDTNINLILDGKGTGNATDASGNRYLTTADEGTGNGIDADTLDGVEGSGYVQTSVQVIAGDGLSDGGALTGNVTLNVDIAGQTENASPATSDWVLVENNAGGTFRKVQLTNLPGGGGGLTDVVDDTTPQLGGDLDTNGSDIVFSTGTGVLSGTTSGDTVLIRVYDVDGASYTTFATGTAGNTPTFNLNTAVTVDGKTILRDATPLSGAVPSLSGTDGSVLTSTQHTFSTTGGLFSRGQTTATNTVNPGITIAHDTTGTAAAGFGVGVVAQAENAAGTLHEIGTLEWEWTTATDTAEVSDLVGYIYSGGAKTEAFRVDTSASQFDLAAGWTFSINGTDLSTGGLGNVVEDTTPQLGGNLDLNGNVITGLEIGVDVQAYDADLTTWAGITPGTGVGTALAVNVGSAGAFVTNGGALGTPSSGVATNLTGTAAGLTAGAVSTITGLAPDTATTQATQPNITSAANLTTVGTLSGGNATAIVDAASTSAAGKVELAIASEVNTGTSASLAVTPDSLAGSNYGIFYYQPVVFDFTTATATGDGAHYLVIPAALDGFNLVEVHAQVITAGTTNSTIVQIHNVDNALDMLTTRMEIGSGQTGSDTGTGSVAGTINTSNDHVNQFDVIRIDVDQVSTTPAQGLIVTLGFQLP